MLFPAASNPFILLLRQYFCLYQLHWLEGHPINLENPVDFTRNGSPLLASDSSFTIQAIVDEYLSVVLPSWIMGLFKNEADPDRKGFTILTTLNTTKEKI